MAEVLPQSRQLAGKAFKGIDALQRAAQHGKAAVHELLVEFHKVHFAGAAEQHPCEQGNHGRAAGK